MIRNLSELTENELSADVCIVGAGAAGMVLARELLDSPLKVIMLEGGTREETPEARALMGIDSAKLAVDERSRNRVLGGTTTTWSGGWKPLDPIDFEKRDWIPFSGWPISLKELIPYYNRAAHHVGAPEIAAYAPVSRDRLRGATHTETTYLRTLPRKNWDFRNLFVGTLEKNERIQVYLDANVVRIHRSGLSIDYVEAASLAGKRVRVRAKWFVLAAGGIENARLLLVSDIGNERDQVGRYYMDHPKGMAGVIHAKPGAILPDVFAGKPSGEGRVLGGLKLTEDEQRTLKTLNSYVQLRPRFGQWGRLRAALARFLPIGIEAPAYELRNFMEQVPSPENRVMLSEKKDALGNPLAKVVWTITDEDKAGLRALHAGLKKELEELGLGELVSDVLDTAKEEWSVSYDASHHIGTTRMGVDPATSVVDSDCAVHSVPNLFIAGSSVFPTSGHANPTATLLALTVRLADHLKSLAGAAGRASATMLMPSGSGKSPMSQDSNRMSA